MPRTDRDQLFRGGELVSETARIVSDAEIEREEAALRLRQGIATLRTWIAEAQANHTNWPTLTNAQKDAANRELHRRTGIVWSRLLDLLLDLRRD